MTYNYNSTNERYSKNSISEKFFELLCFIYYMMRCLVKNEAFVTVCKVSAALICLVSLVSISYFFSIGAIGMFATVALAILLLLAVAYIFSNEA